MAFGEKLTKGLTEPLGRRKSDGTMKKSKKAEKDRPFVKRKLAKIGARKTGIRKKDMKVACTFASSKKRDSGPLTCSQLVYVVRIYCSSRVRGAIKNGRNKL